MDDQPLTLQIRLLEKLLEQGHFLDSAWGTSGPGRDLCEELSAMRLIERDLKQRWQFRPRNHNALFRYKQRLEEKRQEPQSTYLSVKTNHTALSDTSRNAKRSEHKYYLLNAWKPCEWFHLENPEQTLDLYQACQFSGPVSLTFHPEDDLACDQPLALLDNIEPLHHLEQMTGREHFGCALFYHGNLSESLLRWLTTHRRAPEIWLFPDYDYVGLTNYLRIKDALPDAQLFVPDDLEERLRDQNQGCTQRIEDQYKKIDMERLNTSNSPQVKRVMSILKDTGKGLSQESLLIS